MKAQQQQNLTLIAAKWQARLSAAQAALANLQDFIAQNLLAPRVDGGHLYELESAVYAKLEALLLFMDIAVREASSAGWGNEVILRDNLGQVVEWRPIDWRNWRERKLPYGWPDKWPKPWREG